MSFTRHLRTAARNPRTVLFRAAHTLARPFVSGRARYLNMQRDVYERSATASDFRSGEQDECVVGHFHAHNAWPDYDEFLMRGAGGLGLDFACGPGRNIVKYRGRFTRIDGADIAPRNLENARVYLKRNGITDAKLFVTRGADLGDAPSSAYDFIFSSIAMQHIAVHEIRLAILREMYRCLKPGGRLSIQMGYGPGKPDSVDYFANEYAALATNGACDTRVENPDQLRGDLEALGYVQFEHWIRPPGPGDNHPNWIFFQAERPAER